MRPARPLPRRSKIYLGVSVAAFAYLNVHWLWEVAFMVGLATDVPPPWLRVSAPAAAPPVMMVCGLLYLIDRSARQPGRQR